MMTSLSLAMSSSKEAFSLCASSSFSLSLGLNSTGAYSSPPRYRTSRYGTSGAAAVTSQAPNQLFKRVIPVLCVANTSATLKPALDVSFPELNIANGTLLVSKQPRKTSSNRPILGFFAGGGSRIHKKNANFPMERQRQ
ncbi:hypothetical protein C5167_041275 [Papaver somniferum]|uniref:Uncharacterized protein n=1 Tax=Papaver somniferum TaxID=3469 RepID=A0A4Y7IKT2_PAPSO|nr:hypothetical protein C5167_041275 [Papaver somniferum]